MAKDKKEHPFKDFIPEETIDHMKAAKAEFRKSFAGLVPPEFLEHRKAARKEVLLAMRSFLDNAIEQLDTSGSD